MSIQAWKLTRLLCSASFFVNSVNHGTICNHDNTPYSTMRLPVMKHGPKGHFVLNSWKMLRASQFLCKDHKIEEGSELFAIDFLHCVLCPVDWEEWSGWAPCSSATTCGPRITDEEQTVQAQWYSWSRPYVYGTANWHQNLHWTWMCRWGLHPSENVHNDITILHGFGSKHKWLCMVS